MERKGGERGGRGTGKRETGNGKGERKRRGEREGEGEKKTHGNIPRFYRAVIEFKPFILISIEGHSFLGGGIRDGK